MMSKIFPAATVVLVRDGSDGLQTLLLRRSTALSFGSGNWVFPGGRIDKEDYAEDLADIEQAARRSAVRETREEADLTIQEQDLLYFAHWTTPPENPKRFATWFFIAAFTGDSERVTVDGSEIVEHRWYRPSQALAEQQAKTLKMMPPTFVTLTELAGCATVEAAMALYRQRPVPHFLPRFTATEQGIAMLYPGDAGYAAGEQQALGARHRCWMLDEAWRYEKSD
jgi:8-oxo-dGTP pyrophosphatase MutT (NUDIX family)